MGVFDEYCEVHAQHAQAYGPNVSVLYEVGSFYEVYGCGAQGADVRAICALLNIHATRKNKGIPECSPSNPDMGGFPVVALPKYLPVLVAAGYTVVIASQVATASASGGVARAVTKVISRGTWVPPDDDENGGNCTGVWLLSVSLLCAPPPSRALLACGVARLDVRTGRGIVSECLCNLETMPRNLHPTRRPGAFEDVVDQLCAFVAGTGDVAETLVTGDACERMDELLAALEAHGAGRGMLHDRTSTTPDFADARVQEEVFRRAYEDTGLLTPVEYLGLERHPAGTAAFAAALDFAHRHDEALVRNLPAPAVWSSASSSPCEGSVALTADALKDLDVLPSRLGDPAAAAGCLARLLDRCVTPMGRRLFRERLLRPTADAIELARRYDATEALLAGEAFRDLRRVLQGTPDLDRAWRLMVQGQGPAMRRVVHLRSALAAVTSALACAGNAAVLLACGRPVEGVAADISCVLEAVADVGEDGRIADGAFEDVDAARAEVSQQEAAANAWSARVLEACGANAAWVKIAAVEGDLGMHGTCTARRFAVLAPLLAPLEGEFGPLSALDAGGAAGQVRFTHEAVRAVSVRVGETRAALARVEDRRATEVMARVTRALSAEVFRLSRDLASLDVHAAAAKDALEHNLVRPCVDAGRNRGLVSARGLRHPIAERLNTRIPFVPHDVSLGDENKRGILLYGVNAAGKSTLAKALALAVLMAQAGLFVACRELELSPYGSIMTRLAMRDDIYRGKSTFMMELAELRAVVFRAGPRTLVVGDELCSGTESASAAAIVGAACVTLAGAGASFLFATHLHELPRLAAVRSLAAAGAVDVCHLGVRYDEAADALVYERTLAPGPGRALYGLEVARAMHMGAEFMQTAHAIRRELLGIEGDDLAPQRTSHFNRFVFVGLCGACKRRPAEETHHIAPQKLADSRGFVVTPRSSHHKNAAHNLVPLCGDCHARVHAGELDIGPRVATTRGVTLPVRAHREAM